MGPAAPKAPTRPALPTALVAGTGRGGAAEAVAGALAGAGARVTLGLPVVGTVPGLTCLPLDLSDPDSWFPPVLAAGGFDILMIVAEAGADASLLDRGSDLARLMEISLAAPLDLIRLCVPRWRAQGWAASWRCCHRRAPRARAPSRPPR